MSKSKLSLRHNMLANYVSQIYVALIGILILPVYIKYMGAEAYGLVGFYAMLQSWFQLIDMGMTPTVARETARFNGGGISAATLRRLFRVLECIFTAIALLGGVLMLVGADAISNHWLNVQELPVADVKHSVMLMSGIIALRWCSGLYRSVISGFEALVWLSGINAFIATARFVFVLPVIAFLDHGPTAFFLYQLAVACVELLVLMSKAYRLLPKVNVSEREAVAAGSIMNLVGFSLSIGFTSAVWILVTQSDKMILSALLPLKQYAYFSLAVLVAGGIMIISTPMSAALLPRLTRLHAESDDNAIIRLYKLTSQFMMVLAAPATFMLVFFSEQILWLWTHDRALSSAASPILALYAAGNGILAISAFPYYLQFAKGDVKLHVIGNVIFLFALIPFLIAMTKYQGAIGAGVAWLSVNTLYFLFWVPKVHNRFYRGFHLNWMLRDVLLIVMPTGAVAFGLFYMCRSLNLSDIQLFLALAGSYTLLIIVALLFSTHAHEFARRELSMRLR